ncbi:MAG: YbaY family lipoprotein [Cyanobium sp.]
MLVQGALLTMGALMLTPPVRAGRLQGLAVLSQPFPLPPDAVLAVQLLEVSRADTPAVLRGRSRFVPAGHSPFAFMVPYVDGAIVPGGRYQLRATIHQADRLLFSTDATTPVLDHAQVNLRLDLRPVGTAPLQGLLWLRAPAASVPAPPQAPRQEQQLRLDPRTTALSGSADCNRFFGTYQALGDDLRLDLVAGTRLECEPSVIEDERHFLETLRLVRHWRLDPRGRLQLLDGGRQPLLLMETRPL